MVEGLGLTFPQARLEFHDWKGSFLGFRKDCFQGLDVSND